MNPLGFNYGMDTSLVPGFAQPSAIIVTGRGNRYDARFQEARENGGIVYEYYAVISCPDNLDNPADQEHYLIDGERPPLWPYKDANGNPRTNWKGTKLLDIRAGSTWSTKVEEYARGTIERGWFDGLFLDGLGYRPWSKTKVENGVTIPGADWETWPREEQELWAKSAINLARIVHEVRAELQPSFEVVHNSTWDSSGDIPGSTEGERYCNGVVAENSKAGSYWQAQAAKPYAGEPFRKRFLVICPNHDLLNQWKAAPGVTHITLVEKAKGQDYQRLTPPVVPYEDESPPPTCEEKLEDAQEQITALTQQVEQLLNANANLQTQNEDLDSRLEQINQLSTVQST